MPLASVDINNALGTRRHHRRHPSDNITQRLWPCGFTDITGVSIANVCGVLARGTFADAQLLARAALTDLACGTAPGAWRLNSLLFTAATATVEAPLTPRRTFNAACSAPLRVRITIFPPTTWGLADGFAPEVRAHFIVVAGWVATRSWNAAAVHTALVLIASAAGIHLIKCHLGRISVRSFCRFKLNKVWPLSLNLELECVLGNRRVYRLLIQDLPVDVIDRNKSFNIVLLKRSTNPVFNACKCRFEVFDLLAINFVADPHIQLVLQQDNWWQWFGSTAVVVVVSISSGTAPCCPHAHE